MKISDLCNRKILIVGLGIEGVETINFLKRIKFENFAVADINNFDTLSLEARSLISKFNLEFYGGKNYLSNLDDFDLVIKSPGINQKVLIKAKRITTATEIFFANIQSKVIGVTGSKGKSTTANALYTIFKMAFQNVYLLGNIGTPMLSVLPEKTDKNIYITELSSYQLDNLSYSPHCAIITSLFPDHLPYHGSFKNYRNAKLNIFLNQNNNDYAIIYDKLVKSLKPQIKSQIFTFGENSSNVYVKNDYFMFNNELVAPIKKLRLIGRHNLDNISSAICVAKIFGIDNTLINKAIGYIEPLPHRLNWIRNKDGLDYWDDSIAVNPDATISALNTFDHKVGAIILGGYDRKLNFRKLAKKIIELKIPVLVLLPDTGEIIYNYIKQLSKDNYDPHILFTDKMSKAVKFCSSYAPKKSVVLLSPASASFNLWANFIERGNDFINCVKNL